MFFLLAKRDLLEKGAKVLLERETLDDRALAELLGRDEREDGLPRKA